MLIHTIRRRPAIICHEREHAPTSSCRRWRAAMATLIVKHKRLMSKWTQRGGGNTHKQTQIFSRRRSCYGTHLWASLLIVFRRVRLYCRIRSHDVGGSAGANACRAMQCLPRNAMHWLPKWPPTCRRKILGPRFDYFWAAKHVRTPLICRIKTNQNKIQPQKSCLILETRFIPNRPYEYRTRILVLYE